MSRKLDDLTLLMRVKAEKFAGLMAQEGIPFMFTCTYRSQIEQDDLYEQGRTKPGKKVTWTKNSRHTRRDAFDIAILRTGQPTWDVKVDVDKDGIPDYTEAGKIGESLGLIWGGRWGNPDFPHFQYS